ncbi:MAG: hypothetical protein GX920_07185 [Micrococcus sp.]|nr:hypothetical protein [Micrococcus sp.]
MGVTFQLLVVLVPNRASPPTEDRIDQMASCSVNRNLRQVSLSLIKEVFAG